MAHMISVQNVTIYFNFNTHINIILSSKPRASLTGGPLSLYFPNKIYGCSHKRLYCDAILKRFQCDDDTTHTLEAIHSDDINYFKEAKK
jgi:hypothetical protein